MIRNDPYTPTENRYECPTCGNREISRESLGVCPECGAMLRNIAVARE